VYLNIALYQFAAITTDLVKLRSSLHSFGASLDLKGTVLLTPEGVNAFLCGSESACKTFLEHLGGALSLTLHWKESWSPTQAFGKWLVKVKKEVITFDGGLSKPVEGRAPSVNAKKLLSWLQQGHDDNGLPLALIDTRNDVEVVEGTFAGAINLDIRKFTDLKTRILDVDVRQQMQGHRVVTFCTGGIRCEKAAIYMGQQGIENVVQLEGGILRYFEEVGAEHWEGGCFVFDDRENLGPDLKPMQRKNKRTKNLNVD
jgi:UPF0176 protein